MKMRMTLKELEELAMSEEERNRVVAFAQVVTDWIGDSEKRGTSIIMMLIAQLSLAANLDVFAEARARVERVEAEPGTDGARTLLHAIAGHSEARNAIELLKRIVVKIEYPMPLLRPLRDELIQAITALEDALDPIEVGLQALRRKP